ncbi:MAG: hypothetical protein Q9205_003171 [Flavoplaca limonia]
MDPASTNVLRAYEQDLVTTVAFSLEARVCRQAFEQSQLFVKSFEMAHYDGALVQDSHLLDKAEGPARTLFSLLRKYPQDDGKDSGKDHRKNHSNDHGDDHGDDHGEDHGEDHPELRILVVVDMKHLEPICDSKRGCDWKFSISPKQRENCYAFIIASAKEPDYVVLLPAFYLPAAKPRKNAKGSKDKEENESISITPFRPMWMLHQVPAFPGEYTLFIQPVTQLGKALDDMMAVIKGRSTHWTNEHTGAVFAEPPPARLQLPSALLPGQKQLYQAMSQVRELYEAFAKHSRDFRVELVGVSPLLADLKLIGHNRKAELFVEVKKEHCLLESDGRSKTPQLLYIRQVLRDRRLMFSWKSQWDYLFLTVKNMPTKAFLLPRDRIPIPWFNSWPQGEYLKMASGFEEYSVDVSSEESIVRDIERIIHREDQKGSMNATRPIPVDSAERKYLKKGYIGRKDSLDSGMWFQRWSTRGFLRGFGSADHGEARGLTYGQFGSEVMIEICYTSKKGVVCDFGIWNSICRYAIALYNWEPEDVKYYEFYKEPLKRVWNLHKDTQAVPLDFTHMTWTGHRSPSGTSHSEQQAKAARQRTRWPRLMVVDMYSINCMRMPHGRFVVPSRNLGKLGHNDTGLLQKGKGVADQYYIELDDLIDTLTAPLQCNSHFNVGSSQESYLADDYRLTIGEIHQQGVESVVKYRDTKSEAYKKQDC